MLTIYLAGAIRDNHQEDIDWRDQMIQALVPYVNVNILQIISPLGGKRFDKKTGAWTLSGVPSHDYHIVSQDFWSVDKCDIIVANFLPLADGYPSIGTLTEWGRSTATSKLRYVIWPTGMQGHQNGKMYPGPHPFITQNMTEMFPSVADCIKFLMHQQLNRTLENTKEPHASKGRITHSNLLHRIIT